ncbi:hypothetical protein BDW22DRAFT_7625 [Trametopsis cervina]|nr:hypothetical protein BDW22DRAFT_7625 [Trametopsis cervina]
MFSSLLTPRRRSSSPLSFASAYFGSPAGFSVSPSKVPRRISRHGLWRTQTLLAAVSRADRCSMIHLDKAAQNAQRWTLRSLQFAREISVNRADTPLPRCRAHDKA